MAIYLTKELVDNPVCECPRCVVEREAWIVYLAEKDKVNA